MDRGLSWMKNPEVKDLLRAIRKLEQQRDEAALNGEKSLVERLNADIKDNRMQLHKEFRMMALLEQINKLERHYFHDESLKGIELDEIALLMKELGDEYSLAKWGHVQGELPETPQEQEELLSENARLREEIQRLREEALDKTMRRNRIISALRRRLRKSSKEANDSIEKMQRQTEGLRLDNIELCADLGLEYPDDASSSNSWQDVPGTPRSTGSTGYDWEEDMDRYEERRAHLESGNSC
jgi:hypothetical protein